MECKPCTNCGLTGTHHEEIENGRTVTALVHYDTEVGGDTLGYCLRVESYEWGEHWRITRWVEGRVIVRISTSTRHQDSDAAPQHSSATG